MGGNSAHSFLINWVWVEKNQNGQKGQQTKRRNKRLNKRKLQHLVVLINKNEAKYDSVMSKNDYGSDYSEDYAI